MSRANVQTSVMSVTLSGLPSTIVPALSRVTETICATHRNHVIVLCPLHHIGRRAIVGRLLVAGPVSEHITQAQEDEDRQRQEDDGVNIHVVFAFWSAPAKGPAIERSL